VGEVDRREFRRRPAGKVSGIPRSSPRHQRSLAKPRAERPHTVAAREPIPPRQLPASHSPVERSALISLFRKILGEALALRVQAMLGVLVKRVVIDAIVEEPDMFLPAIPTPLDRAAWRKIDEHSGPIESGHSAGFSDNSGPLSERRNI
jgi:hypothetical protein